MKVTKQQLRSIIETLLLEQEGPSVGSTVVGGSSFEFSDKPINPIKKGSPKSDILRLQTLLSAKGFDPGPVDGVYGQKTFNAINDFKKSIDKTPDGIITDSDLKALQSYKKETVDAPKKDLTPKGGILYFGDSQMQGGVGSTLESTLGTGKRIFKVGSTPEYWVSNKSLDLELQKLPQKIVINLGGNGIQKTKELIAKIKSITPNSPILWFGGPPAILKTASPYEKLRSLPSVKRFNNARKANNEFISSLITQFENIQFVDPFDFFNLEEIDAGTAYKCAKCDGVHMPKEIAQKYYASRIPRDTTDAVADMT